MAKTKQIKFIFKKARYCNWTDVPVRLSCKTRPQNCYFLPTENIFVLSDNL